MQLQPLYRATFTTPERWAVEVAGTHGTEVQDFLIAKGRTQGRLAARLRGSNYPRRRTDGTLLADFRGALDTDDGATILFSWHGYARPGAADRREIVGSITHLTVCRGPGDYGKPTLRLKSLSQMRKTPPLDRQRRWVRAG